MPNPKETSAILVAKASHFSASRYHQKQAEDTFVDAFATGANYQIWAGMKGPVSPQTGMVVEINQIKEPLEAFTHKKLDHRCFELCYAKKWKTIDLFNWIFDELSLLCEASKLRLSYLKLNELPRLSLVKESVQHVQETFRLSYQEFADFVGHNHVFVDAVLLFDASGFKKVDLKEHQGLFQALGTFFQTGHLEPLLEMREACAFVGIDCASYQLSLEEERLRLSWPMPFSFQHQLVLDSLSKAENEALFGPCERIHGHSMVLWPEMTIRINHKERLWQQKKEQEASIRRLLVLLEEEDAHQKLCKKTGYPLPSCEVLLSYLKAELIKANISKEALLESLSLVETPRNFFKIGF